MKINIGAGLKRFDDFVNIDSDILTNPDYIVNIETENLPFEDNTVEEVIAHHILEHLGEGYFHVLQEIYRVCKHTAIVNIVVPHHRNELWYSDPTHKRFITVDSMRHFSKKWNDWCVRNFHSSSGFGNRLAINLEMIDFEFIPSELWAPRLKQMSKEEIAEVSSNFNNVYFETHMKLMVLKDA